MQETDHLLVKFIRVCECGGEREKNRERERDYRCEASNGKTREKARMQSAGEVCRKIETTCMSR